MEAVGNMQTIGKEEGTPELWDVVVGDVWNLTFVHVWVTGFFQKKFPKQVQCFARQVDQDCK